MRISPLTVSQGFAWRCNRCRRKYTYWPVTTRHHWAVNDTLDVPALGAIRQFVRQVLGRQRQALPAEVQEGQHQPKERHPAAPLHGNAGPAGQECQSHRHQHDQQQVGGRADRRVNGAAAQQPGRQAEQRPLAHAGRMAPKALRDSGQRSTVQHDAFMVASIQRRRSC